MDRIIALDIGEVCIRLCHAAAFSYFGIDPRQSLPPEFLLLIDHFEKGEIGEDEWLRRVRDFTGGRFSPEEIVHGWNLIVGPPIDGMVELLTELTDAGFRLVFFSDTSPLHIDKFGRDGRMTHLAIGAVYSYEVGAKKPADAMFTAFERDYGRPCFYIDDRPENIAVGERRGWRSHRFIAAGELRRALAAEFGNLFPG